MQYCNISIYCYFKEHYHKKDHVPANSYLLFPGCMNDSYHLLSIDSICNVSCNEHMIEWLAYFNAMSALMVLFFVHTVVNCVHCTFYLPDLLLVLKSILAPRYTYSTLRIGTIFHGF